MEHSRPIQGATRLWQCSMPASHLTPIDGLLITSRPSIHYIAKHGHIEWCAQWRYSESGVNNYSQIGCEAMRVDSCTRYALYVLHYFLPSRGLGWKSHYPHIPYLVICFPCGASTCAQAGRTAWRAPRTTACNPSGLLVSLMP